MTNNELVKKIGANIRLIRESKGVSIQELADRLEMEYNNLIRIEKGRTNPTIITLLNISNCLGVSLIDLINVDS